jgi:hypothetical protein
MRTQKAVFCAALVIAFLPRTAVAQPTRPTVKLRIVEGRPVVDGVFLNGQGPYQFLLDTGSQSNQVDSRLARKLGLTASLQLDLHTPSGLSHVRGGKVANVTLGAVSAAGVSAQDQEFLITSLEGLHALSPDIQGILGQEFLAHFDYTLDFQHHQLTFGDAPPTSARVAVRVVSGCMGIPTSEGELMLDSGINTLLFFRKSSQSPTAYVNSASSLSASASVGFAPALRIGDRLYHPANAVFEAVANAPGQGLLPANMFHAVYISNSEGFVIFDPETR